MRGEFYSLWCHLRKPLSLGKLSEWMECFFRHPRCTFFHCRTSVCLFLFQIHSIIPDCTKHSRSPTFLFPLLLGSPTTISPRPNATPLPQHPPPFFFSSFLIMNGRSPRKDPSFFFLSMRRNLGYFRWRKALILREHLAGILCGFSKTERKQTQSSTCRWRSTKTRIFYLSAVIGHLMRSSRNQKCHRHDYTGAQAVWHV